MKIFGYTIAVILNLVFWLDVWIFETGGLSWFLILGIVGLLALLSPHMKKESRDELWKHALKGTGVLFGVIFGLVALAALVAVTLHSLDLV